MCQKIADLLTGNESFTYTRIAQKIMTHVPCLLLGIWGIIFRATLEVTTGF
jgi:hypothetical protein